MAERETRALQSRLGRFAIECENTARQAEALAKKTAETVDDDELEIALYRLGTKLLSAAVILRERAEAEVGSEPE